jgi:hypothetical protein
MKKKWLWFIPLVLAAATLGVFVFSGVVMLLWNGILPAVLHVGTITILQAAGILLLARMLFGGRRRRMAGGCHDRRRFKKMRYCEYKVVNGETAC